MLRIAVPNKGSLSDPAVALLIEAGYKQRRDPRELVLTDSRNEVEFFFLRPRDVAVYVGSGTVHAGITGRDLLLDSGAAATEILELGFGGSTFRYAAPPGEITSIQELAGKRVATSYEHLVDTHLRSFGIEADVVRLDGAVESSVRLGVADAVADVVSTGTTLKAAGLEVFGEPLLKSEAILVRARSVPEADVAVLAARLRGVLMA
ncbi:MAG TPA: ATP phosphoribosyltransferase, partial [Demequina sp.]|nr:ATP phosphoribosyltransferase [Demequina sp.]